MRATRAKTQRGITTSATKWLVGLCLIALFAAAMPASAQLCAPLDNGRIATPFYEGTTIFWDPLYEYEEIRLTITGPCEDIVRTFGPKDPIFFDIREVERIVDGQYGWTLQRVATVDEGVKKILQAARDGGKEDAVWWDLFQAGKIPEGPYSDSGAFTVERGAVIDPSSGEEKSLASKVGDFGEDGFANGLTLGDALADSSQLPTKATVLTNADGVIRNSLCVGFDCPNNPTFSDSTIILTENNTRLKFDDTSSINSFPRTDWEIEANSNLNGGLSYLAFNDCGQSSGGGCASDLVFGVEGGARQHALWVESDGDVGIGTQNPVVRLHVTDGDTPALRLEQDGSSGFQPQVWDIAGNETSFFIRDATNGSTLPFRIFPGASSNTLVVDGGSDVGIGTTSPDAKLEVVDNVAEPSQPMLLLNNTGGPPRLEQTNGAGGHTWRQTVTGGGAYNVDDILDGTIEFSLAQNGNLTISGNIITTNCPAGCGPDYVFAEGYDLLSLDELSDFITRNKHLPNVPPAKEMETVGIDMTKLQLRMLEKIEELTLYTLEQHRTIHSQGRTIGTQSVVIEELRSRLAALEARAQE